MNVLAERLFKSAQHFAESALVAYDRGDVHVFLLHAGTALEHLSKARLAELNPVLIAKRDHVQSLVWFADESKQAAQAIDTRTITLDEALVLLSALKAPISQYRDDIMKLQRYRNGVAHFGLSDKNVARQVLPSFLSTLTALACELGRTREDFFRAYDEFVLTQLAEHRQAEERDYAGRVAHAKLRFQNEHGSLDAPALQRLRELAELRWRRMSLQDQLVDCPVCGLPAHAEGDLHQVDWDVDYDKEGNPEGAWPVLEFQPVALRCPTCGLVLDTASLVALSGAFENWDLPDEDYDAYMRELEEEARDWADYYERY